MLLSSRSRQGATLVEMLVAFAVTATLLALLFGGFAKVSGISRQVKCISNLRQISRAFLGYAMDHNGAFPYYAYWYSNESNAGAEPGIRDYFGLSGKDAELRFDTFLTCPTLQSNPATRVKATELFHRNYTLNLSATSGHKTYSLKNINLIPIRSVMLLVFDGSIMPDGSDNSQVYHRTHGYDTFPERFQAPHNGRMNVCFLDGHAASMTIKELLDARGLEQRWMGKE